MLDPGEQRERWSAGVVACRQPARSRSVRLQTRFACLCTYIPYPRIYVPHLACSGRTMATTWVGSAGWGVEGRSAPLSILNTTDPTCIANTGAQAHVTADHDRVQGPSLDVPYLHHFHVAAAVLTSRALGSVCQPPAARPPAVLAI